MSQVGRRGSPACKQKERRNGWRVGKTETSSKNEEKLENREKGQSQIVSAGIKQTYV